MKPSTSSDAHRIFWECFFRVIWVLFVSFLFFYVEYVTIPNVLKEYEFTTFVHWSFISIAVFVYIFWIRASILWVKKRTLGPNFSSSNFLLIGLTIFFSVAGYMVASIAGAMLLGLSVSPLFIAYLSWKKIN